MLYMYTYLDSAHRIKSAKSLLYSKYNQTIFKHATKIFSALQHEPRDEGTYESAQKRKLYKSQSHEIPHIKYENDTDRKLTYELSYSTLKCK